MGINRKDVQSDDSSLNIQESRRNFIIKATTGSLSVALFLINKVRALVDQSADNLFFSNNHTWVRVNGDTGVIGVTNHVQESLGSIGCVELPKVGETLRVNEIFGGMASVSVIDLLMPVSGKITHINDAVIYNPGLINGDAYGKGWLIQISFGNKKDLQKLIRIPAYEELIKRDPIRTRKRIPPPGAGLTTYVVTEACVNCKYTDCAAICPVDAFHELPDRLYINPEICIGCDACVRECPVEAIFRDDLLPEKYEKWLGLNAEAAKSPVICYKKPALRLSSCSGPPDNY
jgi:ferredoxin